MEHWYALHAKPHKERQVAEHLRHHKVEVYLPIVRVNPVNPRAARERPYFPCYLFLRADLDAIGVSLVRWTPGLRDIVQVGSQPAVVPDNLIIELKRRLGQIRAAGGLVFDGLHVGGKVKITQGAFAGYEAVFDARLSGAERVRVLLELIQKNGRQDAGRARYIPLELNAGHIEKVKVQAMTAR